jgi:hypothetical protein
MIMRTLVLSGLLVFASAGASAATLTRPPTDAKEYLADIDHTLLMASKGEYGKLRRGADARMRAERERMANLLNGHASTDELTPAQQVALANSEEVFKSILHNEDKSRIVCTFGANTGSRIATKECMSVADREERARRAKLLVKDSQVGHWDGLNQ